MTWNRGILVCVGVVLLTLVFFWTNRSGLVSSPFTPKGKKQQAIDEQDDEPYYTSNSSKPWFIIHMGPTKTATTTIEMELTRKVEILALDNYSYFGKYYKPPGGASSDASRIKRKRDLPLEIMRDLRCHRQVHAQRVAQRGEIPSCWTNLVSILREKHRGKNILMSDEEFGCKFAQWVTLDGKADTSEPPSPIDWKSLQRDIGRDWNIMAIVGYRRLVDWIPSARQQNDRWFRGRKSARVVMWPPTGKPLEPLFPNALTWPQVDPTQSKQAWYHYWTDDSLNNLRDYNIPVRVFNMHQPGVSVRTNFFCLIPDAHHLCQDSMDHEDDMLTANQAKTSSLYYDAIATKLNEQGVVDTHRWKRHQVMQVSQKYHERVLNATASDFPMLCPPRSKTQVLLDASLKKEREIVGVGVLSEDEHRQVFENNEMKKKYCWIDIDTVIAEPEWVDFAEHLDDYMAKFGEP